MTIWVSSLAKVHGLAERHAPSMIVSLLSPYDAFPSFPDHAPERHLKVAVHDIASDIGDWKAPGRSDAEQLVRFLAEWDLQSPLLVHCWAGISRSSATAFIAACLHNPGVDEADIARAVRAASPTASPNVRLVGHADDILGRQGRMNAAVTSIGKGLAAEEAHPFSIPSIFSSPTIGRP